MCSSDLGYEQTSEEGYADEYKEPAEDSYADDFEETSDYQEMSPGGDEEQSYE